MKDYAVTSSASPSPAFTREDRLITEAEAAELLRISQPTLKRFRYKKKIKFYKIGILIRYSEKHITDFLDSCSSN